MSAQRRRTCFLLFGFFVSVVTVLLFWKCRFGFGNNDEAFYLTIPIRLCQGDSLLLHEWHFSQLSGVLLYPAVWLYRVVFPDTVGILFHFRLFFTFVWVTGALFVFARLKSFSLAGAMLASLVFLLYTPYGIMALSYNSMGILLLLCACVLAVSSEYSRVSWFFAGIFLSGAILCCPYLLILYVLFSAAAFGALFWRKKNVLHWWLFCSLGCGLVFALFCLLLFSRASFRDLIIVLPELFRDPEHSNFGLLSKLQEFFKCIIFCNRAFIPGILVFLLGCFLGFRKNGRRAGFILACIAASAILGCFLLEKPYLNFLMYPICLPGLYCAVTSRDSSVRRLFLGAWLPGAIYSFCIHLSSNQKFYAVSSASTVMAVASIMIMVCYLCQKDWEDSSSLLRKAPIIAFAILILMQLCGEAFMRFNSAYLESDLQEQTVLCESGPEKGILMTTERFQDYRLHESDVAIILDDESINKVLFLSRNTYLYLFAEKEYATYSAWLSGVNEITIERLDRYYDLFPEKTPDGIYIEADYLQFSNHFLDEGYVSEELPSGALWLTRQPS